MSLNHKRKNILRSVPLIAFSTESFHTENYGVHGLLTQATIV